MSTNLDETELARLEALAVKATPCPWFEMNHGAFPMVYGPNCERVCRAVDNAEDSEYIAAACNAVPALAAEVRRLRERVEAWEWLFEVIEYDVYEDHPLSSRWGHDMSDKERETYVNARISYAHIEDAAREAVHADRE